MTKKHFKLYKSGKKWCMMALTTIITFLGMAGIANADTVASVPTNDTEIQVINNQLTMQTANTDDSSEQQSQAVETQNSNMHSNQQPTGERQSQVVHVQSSNDDTTNNGWVKNDETNQWTYYNNGQKTNGKNYLYLPTIGKNDGSHNWYLVDNGTAQAGVQQWAGTYYYFDPTTYLRVDNDYRQSQWGDWYLFGNDGRIQTGVQQWAGTYYYFDPTTYLRVDNDYRQSQWGNWYMFGPDGRIISGLYSWKGCLYYFTPNLYTKATNQQVFTNGKSYWANGDGIIVSGLNFINNYILNRNIGHANITFYDNGQAIPLNITGKYSGTGNGLPNMVVVHETANPNDSIWGEINYEKQYYNNAFVHAFIDNNNIIQISDTDHEAWGAGYPANGRAVQFEQVEVHNADAFVHELSNAAYYTAYIMHKYDFAPSLVGTLWSHHNVSQYLGGTDHTDPDGYWYRNAHNFFGTNYTMSDFYELVSLYYGEF